jgi:DNA polymerase elongation subunit (family B)
MLHHLNLRNILFLDIETVPQFRDYHDLPVHFLELWQKKCTTLRRAEDETPEVAYKRAGIYAEFGKIICISCGCFGNGNSFRIKSFYGDDEKELLKDFSLMLEKSFNTPDKILCAHNGKEFDFPYICRRLLVNHLPLPSILQIAGKKPWEIAHIDTMELWKFGDFKSFTSLNLLAAIFDIPTPKDDIDGSMVGNVYWEESNLERIVTYCEKDVLTVAQILRKFRGESLIEEYNIELATA